MHKQFQCTQLIVINLVREIQFAEKLAKHLFLVLYTKTRINVSERRQQPLVEIYVLSISSLYNALTMSLAMST